MIYKINNDKITVNKEINNYESYQDKLDNNMVKVIEIKDLKRDNYFFKYPEYTIIYLFTKN